MLRVDDRVVSVASRKVYDLALAPGDNVSQSPGFETPLGIFGGQSK